MVTEGEVGVGLVLHLDPDTLAANGGSYTCPDEQRVQGGHFFLCLAVDDSSGQWLPLYSNSGVGREPLGEDGRSGHSKWSEGTFYWHRDQVWSAPHAAVVAAASAGGDMSRSGSRNRLDELQIPSIAANGS
jgi:hypothetical protein